MQVKFNKTNIEVNVDELQEHYLSKINPLMREHDYIALMISLEQYGQLEPIWLFRGKVIDGRHRLKALKEIGSKTIKANELYHLYSKEQLKELLIMKHTHRSEDAMDKAIKAFREYKELLQKGEEITKIVIEKKYGAKSRAITRLETIHQYLGGDETLAMLFSGKLLKYTDEQGKVKATRSLDKLYSLALKKKNELKEEMYFKEQTDTNIEDIANNILINIQQKYGEEMLLLIKNKIEEEISSNKTLHQKIYDKLNKRG